MSYYYSRTVSLWSLRTFKELMRYDLNHYTNHVCLSRNENTFYCGDFSGHLYRFSYLDEKMEKHRRVHKKSVVIAEVLDWVVSCSEKEVRIVNSDFMIIKRIVRSFDHIYEQELSDHYSMMTISNNQIIVALKNGDLEFMSTLGSKQKLVEGTNERILDMISNSSGNEVYIRTSKHIYTL